MTVLGFVEYRGGTSIACSLGQIPKFRTKVTCKLNAKKWGLPADSKYTHFLHAALIISNITIYRIKAFNYLLSVVYLYTV